MIDSTLRSPNEKTRSTMSCSISWTEPSSAPSAIMDLISSSVTIGSSSRMPMIFTSKAVLWVRIQTKGAVNVDRNCIGPATTLAMRSE